MPPPPSSAGNGASGSTAGLLHKPSCVRSASAFGCCVVACRLTPCRFGVIAEVPPQPTNPLTQRSPATLSGTAAPHHRCHNGVNGTVVADAVVVVARVRVKGFGPLLQMLSERGHCVCPQLLGLHRTLWQLRTTVFEGEFRIFPHSCHSYPTCFPPIPGNLAGPIVFEIASGNTKLAF